MILQVFPVNANSLGLNWLRTLLVLVGARGEFDNHQPQDGGERHEGCGRENQPLHELQTWQVVDPMPNALLLQTAVALNAACFGHFSPQKSLF